MKQIDIYCDESRQDLIINQKIINENNKYIVLGGIWVNKEYREEIKKSIKSLQIKHNVYGEMKWKNVSDSKIDFYNEIIELFFKLDSNKISFRSIVIDSTKLNIQKYHENSHELGFYKFYYQLLQHWIEKENQYNIFLDFRKDKSKNRVYEMKNIINNSLKNEVVKNIQFINSKESILIQLEDIIMGAVGYKYNYGYDGKSKAKNQLIETIEKYNVIKETEREESKFNIFKIKLRGGK